MRSQMWMVRLKCMSILNKSCLFNNNKKLKIQSEKVNTSTVKRKRGKGNGRLAKCITAQN